MKNSIHQYSLTSFVDEDDDQDKARQAIALEIGTLILSFSQRADAPLESHLENLEKTLRDGSDEGYTALTSDDDHPYPHLRRILSEDELLDIEDVYETRANEMVKEYSEIMSSDRYEILEEVDSNVKKFHYIPSDERHAEELKLYTDVKDGLSSLEAELNKFHSLKDKVSANKEERMKQMKTPRRLSDESSPMFDDPNFATHRQLVTVDDCDGGDLLCSTAVGTIVATTAAIDVVLNEIGATLDLFDIVSNSCKHASSCLLIISLPSLTS